MNTKKTMRMDDNGKRYNKLCGPVKTIKVDPKTKKETVVKVEEGQSYWAASGKKPWNKKKPDAKYKRPLRVEPEKKRQLVATEKKDRDKEEQALYQAYVERCKRSGERVIIGFTRWRRIHRAGVIG